MNPTRTHLPTSWAATLPILLHAIEHGDDDSRATARAELIRLAEIADCAIERDRAESMGGQ